MDEPRSRLLDAIHHVAIATDEAACLQCIAEQAERLFGSLRPVVVAERPGPTCGPYPLTAAGELLGEIAIDTGAPVPLEVSSALRTFAAHAGLALRNARMLDEYEQRSRRDGLTGLRNGDELRETLSRLLGERGSRRGGTLSLVVIDLDHFKEVNHRHGHGAGDRLLRSCAAVLSAVCRAGDSAYRIGGDEFALVLPGAEPDQGVSVARRAAEALTGIPGCTGASHGVASAPRDGHTRDELMAAADAAMDKRRRA